MIPAAIVLGAVALAACAVAYRAMRADPKRVQRIELQPGDRLMLVYPHVMPNSQKRELEDSWARLLDRPVQTIAVLDGGPTLHVVKGGRR